MLNTLGYSAGLPQRKEGVARLELRQPSRCRPTPGGGPLCVVGIGAIPERKTSTQETSMAQKRCRRTSLCDGFGFSPRQVASPSCSAVRRRRGYGPLLGPADRRPTSGPSGLGGSIAGSQTHSAYVGRSGAKDPGYPSSPQAAQRAGRAWSGRHSSRVAGPASRVVPLGANDRSNPSTQGCVGSTETCSPSASVARLVPAGGSGRERRSWTASTRSKAWRSVAARI